MKQVQQFKSRQVIEQEAADWVIKIDRQDLDTQHLDAQQRAELDNWLAQSQSHRQIFYELVDNWSEMDAWVASGRFELDASENLKKSKIRINSFAVVSLAACFLCALLIAFLFVDHRSGYSQLQSNGEYATRVGAQKSLELSDGSLLQLNTRSQVKVAYSKEQRAIYLLEGEAHFKVAKNSTWPFVVYVGDTAITAVGTAFNVRKFEGATDLLVTEGKVAVRSEVLSKGSSLPSQASVITTPPKNKNNAKPELEMGDVMVLAGEQLRLEQQVGAVLSQVNQNEMGRQLAWQDGMLSFDDTPLAEAIAEISRYTKLKIEIADDTTAKIPVGGYFKTGEVDALLEVLELGFDIKVEHLSENTVLLSRETTAL